MSRAEGMTLRDVARQLRDWLGEPARQATLLGIADTLLETLDRAPSDQDLLDLTGAVVKSLQEHGTSHETAACNGCIALSRLTGYMRKGGSRPFEPKAIVDVAVAAMRAFPRNADLQGPACAIIANFCGMISMAELVAAGGAVDAVAAALLSAGEKVESGTAISWQIPRRRASFALGNCCIGMPAAAARAHQLGAASAILAALSADDPCHAAMHCRALSVLAREDPRVILPLLSKGAVEALAEVIRAQPFDAILQCFGLSALGDFLANGGGDDSGRRASDAGAAELALTALREEGRMVFRRDAEALRLTRNSVRVSALCVIGPLPAAGAAVARAVTEAMVAHPEHEETQINVCLILDSIAHLQQEREAAIAAGAPEAIVRALRRFPELGDADAWARGAGWRALAEMSSEPSRLLPAVAAGGVEAACDGLQRHLATGEERVIINVLRALIGLLHASDLRGDRGAACAVKRRGGAAGCADLLVSAARKHTENADIACKAAVALGDLSAGEPICAERVVKAGGVEVACAALRCVLRRDNPVDVYLCTIGIGSISFSSLAGAVRARKAGALELLAEAIRSFPEGERVQRECIEAIRSVARNDLESRRWAAKELGFDFAEEEDSAAPVAALAEPDAPLGSAGTAAEAPPLVTTSAAGQAGGAKQHERAPRRPRRTCDHCGAQVGGGDPLGRPVLKLSACGGCRAVRYCSVACSREAWRNHKAACKETQAEAAAAAANAASDAASRNPRWSVVV